MDCQVFIFTEEFRSVESPFDRKSRDAGEFVHASEVPADFHLCPYAEIEILVDAFDAIEVDPELRFGQEYELIPFFEHRAPDWVLLGETPKIEEAVEGKQTVQKVHVPSAGDLIGVEVVRTQMLVHGRDRKSTCKGGVVVGVGGTDQSIVSESKA